MAKRLLLRGSHSLLRGLAIAVLSVRHLAPSVLTCDTTESKNSSQHNQSKKAHRNGIKKPKTSRYPSLKGTDPKFRRNHRHALHGTMKALKELKDGKRDTA
ncbi:60S ribosomal protein L29 [Lachnellula cervina]|uniref:60S ribosomal protein L29 n=1 Tax=Lachnellula cervina TaxID=1316786 RepID=A0A7D8YXB7_9HELO|nr:60S ribosomal protein L29 [Lachnellula cervina]